MTFPHIPRPGVVLFLIGIAWTIIEYLVLVIIYPGHFIPKTVVSIMGSLSPAFFNTGAVILSAVLLLLSVYLLARENTGIWFIAPMALAGLGTAGVGIFSQTDTSLQAIALLAAYFCCGLCAIFELHVLQPERDITFSQLNEYGQSPRLPATARREYYKEYSPSLSIFIIRSLTLVFIILFSLILSIGPESIYFRETAILVFIYPVFIAGLGLRTYLRAVWWI